MKQTLLIFISLLISVSLSAKTAAPVKVLENYVYFDAGGGIHGLHYNINQGSANSMLGSIFNLGFCYSYSHEWALKVGLGLQSYSAVSILNTTDTLKSIDSDGNPYVFRAKFINKAENQKALFLDLPVGVQYRKILNPKFTLQASSGLTFSVPLSKTFETTSGEIKTSGAYSQYNLPNMEDPKDQGFTSSSNNYSGKLALYPSLSLSMDVGVLYHLKEKVDFYLGSYFNYGVTDLQKAQNKLLIQPNGANPIYNGVFATDGVNRVNSFSIGVKAGVYIGFVPPKPSRRAAPAKGGRGPGRSANRR